MKPKLLFMYTGEYGTPIDRYDKANGEICKWGMHELSHHFDIITSTAVAGEKEWNQIKQSLDPNTIILAVAGWEVTACPPWTRTFNNFPNIYIMNPWAYETKYWRRNHNEIDVWEKHHLEHFLAAKRIFAICGRIWFDRTRVAPPTHPWYPVRKKLIHLNMCVDVEFFRPWRKVNYNEPIKRGFYHSSALWEVKRPQIMIEALRPFKNPVMIGSHGYDWKPPFQNWKTLGYVNNSDNINNIKMSGEIDFYIHTGEEPQSTSILEGIARGFIPCVCPESGFYHEAAIMLSDDTHHNNRALYKAINLLSNEELQERRDILISVLEKEHNWYDFYNTIAKTIYEDMGWNIQNQR